MKVTESAMTQSYVFSTDSISVFFDRFEKFYAGKMMSIHLYDRDRLTGIINYGNGEEFCKAWRAMQCK